MTMRTKTIFYMLHVTGYMLLFAFSVSAQTWQGPPAGSTPPENNRPAPVHVGSETQAKPGPFKATDLEATTGDVKGVRLCIGADCKDAWSQVGGVSQWTTSAANIYYTTGNVGIGTTTPNKQLHVKTESGNAEIDLQSAGSPYWAMYQDDTTDQLRFWNGDNRLTLTTDGKVTAAQFQAFDPASGSGLPLTVRGGNASTAGGGAGGNLNLIAGSNIPAGGAGYVGLGAPGAVTIKGSNGYNSVGGNVNIDAGQTSYWAQGTVHADVAITGGSGINANDPAKVTVQGGYAGNSNSTFSTGGNVVIQSGLGQGGGGNGNIQLLNGNVGIGTTIPSSLLNLKQSVGTNAGALRITNGSVITYLYGDATGTVHFDNSGAKLLLNESGGNVGIGTTTPGAKLEVAGGNMVLPYLNWLQLRASGGGYWNVLGTTDAGTVAFRTIDNGATARVQMQAYDGTPVASFQNNGNVGIGTAAPVEKLEVAGNVKGQGLCIGADCRTSWPAGGTSQWTTSGTTVYYNGGNVGIGTASPGLKTHIVGALGWPATSGSTQTGVLRLAGSGSSVGLDFSVNGASGASLQVANSDSLSASYPLILNPNGGNVGIGTASPGAKLEVAGDVLVGGSTASGKAVYSAAGDYLTLIGGNAGGAGIRLGSGSPSSFTERVRIDGATGNVGIGTASPAVKLEVAGNMRMSGGTRYIQFLDSGGTDKGYIGDAKQFITTPTQADDDTLGIRADANIVFGISSTERMRIDSSGNVGIGTTSPATKLDVAGQVRTGTAGGTGNGLLVQFSPGLSGTYSNLYAMSGVDDTLVLQSYNSKPLAINPGGNNVGIGTTSPTQTLDVAGYVKGQGLCIGTDCKTAWSQVGGGTSQWTTSGTNVYYNGGNVGIGTASPAAKLHILGSSQNTLALDSPSYPELTLRVGGAIKSYDAIATTAGGYFGASGVGDRIIRADAGNILFGYGPSETVRITTAGNVGIGTTGPGYKLDVSGDIRATGAIYANANGAKYFQGGDDASLNDINIANTLGVFGTQDTTVASIKLGSNGGTISGYNGNVGIGTTAPTQKLDVAGNITASGSIAAGTISTNGLAVSGNMSASGNISAGNGLTVSGGNINALQGIRPNYDSGWFTVNSQAGDQEILKTHSLGTVPSQFMLLQCGAISGSTCTTRTVLAGTGGPAVGNTINPVTITSDSSNIYIGLTGWWAWGYWTPSQSWNCSGDADANCYTAYYRILAWK